ncbi:MAG TPA: hypothetical protein H9870_11770 [Candidatus Corynebacterium avicola]|uniref:FAD-binding FR-type domain-containing protein n=1 Tax=Candidatus Corynebacterium avicola TaxID=2838527 RepID=A0A9D1UMY5_9CORY|nr:hypothetical protein [Candidatus Corynebacterium avicola]
MTASGSALDASLETARENLDAILDRGRLHYAGTAPAATPVDEPSGAAGTSAAAATVDLTLVRRAALFASTGVNRDGTFEDPQTAVLADLGRDLRKYGVGTDHYAAIGEAATRAITEVFGCPDPGTDLTYRHAEELGIPDGVTELLQVVDHAVRIAALGAVEDEDAGIPATLPATVLEVERRTPRVTVVRLAADLSRPKANTGWPGQYLEVRSAHSPTSWRKMASAIPPNPDGYLEFHLSHPVGDAPAVSAGDTWVVANPTGALEVPEAARNVLMVAVDDGLAALRSLVLDLSSKQQRPQVHLYWSTGNPEDLHEQVGLEGFDRGFDWFTFSVGTAADAVADASLMDGASYDTVLVAGTDTAATVAALDGLPGTPRVIS